MAQFHHLQGFLAAVDDFGIDAGFFKNQLAMLAGDIIVIDDQDGEFGRIDLVHHDIAVLAFGIF